MKFPFPSAEEYSAQSAHYPALTVVDIQAEQSAATGSYSNHVLVDVNADCMRLAVFEGEYRWHRHPDSDELFLVVAGLLQIDLADGSRLELTEWQSVVIPAVQCIGHEPSGVRSTSPARRRAQRRYLSRPSPDNSFKVDGYAATQLWRWAS